MDRPFTVRGVIVPLLTPFDGALQVDEGALRAHVRWLIDKGVSGVMPCGTTGEGPLLTTEERRRVLEVVVEAASGRVPVIAHVGAVTTRETVELARHAEAAGAGAISVVTPYYFRLPDGALVDHFARVAGAVPGLPVFLYNIPQYAVNTITRAVAEEVLRRAPNVVGIKDSSGSLESLVSFVGLDGGRFQVVCGPDGLILQALQAGACASVSGNANVFPEVVVGLVEAAGRGDWEGARRQQELLNQVRAAMGDGGYLGLFKAVLGLRGRPMGGVRPPLPGATPETIAAAEGKLRELGLLNDAGA